MSRSFVNSRTELVDYSHDRYRHADWLLVNTNLGAMFQPKVFKFEMPADDLDMDDDFFRIDHMNFDWDMRDPVWRDEGVVLHGGLSILGQNPKHTLN